MDISTVAGMILVVALLIIGILIKVSMGNIYGI